MLLLTFFVARSPYSLVSDPLTSGKVPKRVCRPMAHWSLCPPQAPAALPRCQELRSVLFTSVLTVSHGGAVQAQRAPGAGLAEGLHGAHRQGHECWPPLAVWLLPPWSCARLLGSLPVFREVETRWSGGKAMC